MPGSYRAIADFYDAEYEGSRILQLDVPFFLGHLPSRRPQRVLDIACGTGRSCIPVAQAGHRVVGVDFDRKMIDLATRKRDSVGLNDRQLRFVCANALELDLGKERFDWVTVFFNTFLNFTTLEKQDDLLSRIHRHLRPRRGRLWLDVFQPNLEILAKPESRGHDPTLFFVPSLGRTVQRTADIVRDPSRQVQHVTFRYVWFDEFGQEQRAMTRFDLTFMFPRELRLLLERNGFEVEAMYGDYDGSALNADSPRMITLAGVV